MYEYCEAADLPHERCGKLICAPTEADGPTLAKLKATGDANGVEGLEIIDGAAVSMRVPFLFSFFSFFLSLSLFLSLSPPPHPYLRRKKALSGNCFWVTCPPHCSLTGISI